MWQSHTRLAGLAKQFMPATSWRNAQACDPRAMAIPPRSHLFSQKVPREMTEIAAIDCETG